MLNIVFWLYIFLDIISLFVFVDVILSWPMIFGINLRPQFLANIIDPIYKYIKNNISTTIWPMDFTPIVVIFWIYFLKILIISFFPEVSKMIQLYSGIL